MNTEIREAWRRKGLIEQHQPSHIKNSLNGVFAFTDVKYGDFKKGQGDVVIVNCKVIDELKEFVTLYEYLNHTMFIDKIEEDGIYTNIFYSKEFFEEVTKQINLTKF